MIDLIREAAQLLGRESNADERADLAVRLAARLNDIDVVVGLPIDEARSIVNVANMWSDAIMKNDEIQQLLSQLKGERGVPPIQRATMRIELAMLDQHLEN